MKPTVTNGVKAGKQLGKIGRSIRIFVFYEYLCLDGVPLQDFIAE